jgi:hypothetical protein
MRPTHSAAFYLILLAGPGILFLGLFTRILPPGLRPLCLTHALTGFPCPGCGSFRALSLFIGGHLKQAFLMQPLMTALFTLVLLSSLTAGILWLLRLPVPNPPRIPSRLNALLIGLATLLMLLNWLYLVAAGI